MSDSSQPIKESFSTPIAKEPRSVWIGKYLYVEKDYAGLTWLYGPNGDGFSLTGETKEQFVQLLERFFKEHM